MATYSLKRENAKRFLSSDRYQIPGYPDICVQGPYLIPPDGSGIPINSCIREFEHWNYCQKLIGYTSPIPPVLPKNPFPDCFKALVVHLDYLIDLYEADRSNKGIGHQWSIYDDVR